MSTNPRLSLPHITTAAAIDRWDSRTGVLGQERGKDNWDWKTTFRRRQQGDGEAIRKGFQAEKYFKTLNNLT